MEITTEVYRDAIIDALTHGCGEDDPIKFVMDLDAAMGDEGFTENLLLSLAESYEKEYTTYEEHLHGQVLESTFAAGPGDPRYISSKADEASSKRSKLSQIVALIKSLDDD